MPDEDEEWWTRRDQEVLRVKKKLSDADRKFAEEVEAAAQSPKYDWLRNRLEEIRNRKGIS